VILLTGATGFLGGVLARRLLQHSVPVRVLVRAPERAAPLRALGAEQCIGDVRDPAAVLAAASGATHVVHCAALSAPWGRRSDFVDVNVGGTTNVVAACLAQRVRRLVHVSSPSVTFDGSDQCDLTEAAPYPARFVSTYSWTKKLAEDVVRDAAREGLDATILRPKAIFGPGDTTLVPRLLTAARQGRLRQIGDGANRVDLTYVDNVAAAIERALDAPAAAGRTYTVTNGEHPALWEVLRLLLDGCDTGPSPARALPRVSVRGALAAAALMEARARLLGGEPALTRYAVLILARTQTYDIAAARRDLGYAPEVSLAEGIERTIAALASRAAA
jgi:2-alkyl-3-oxoalkanoate reductase